MSNMTRKFGNAKLIAVHYAPAALTAIGIGALIASGVVAAMRTEKLTRVVDKFENEMNRWEKEATLDPVYKEGEYSLDKLITYREAFTGTIKVYGPALALAAVGTVSVLYSHGLMKKRNAALVSAYGVLDQAYRKYRDRVAVAVGEEIEQDIHRGTIYEFTEPDSKTKERKLEPVKDGHIPVGTSEYSVWFGPDNDHWNSRPEYNVFFLRGQEKYLNHQLNVRGHVMLNDVYDALRIPRTPAGAVVGWVHDGDDQYVSFGLPEAGSPEEQDYFYFFDQESRFLLDFNVDGIVYDKIGKKA